MLIDYIGLTVQEVTELRNQFRAAGIEYKVLKNTMISRAADLIGISGLENLSGPTAVAFSYTDPTAGAKIILDYQKKTRKTKIKLGVLGKTMITRGRSRSEQDPSRKCPCALWASQRTRQRFRHGANGPDRASLTALNAIKNQKESAEHRKK